RLYEHLRDTTKEGTTPKLEGLATLYQAISHGCNANRHQDTLDKIYINRICRRRRNGTIEYYASKMLGASSSNLAAIGWFFERPYDTPEPALGAADKSWVLSQAAHLLRTQGRFMEALPADRAGLRMDEDAHDWLNAAVSASNLSQVELLVGRIDSAIS